MEDGVTCSAAPEGALGPDQVRVPEEHDVVQLQPQGREACGPQSMLEEPRSLSLSKKEGPLAFLCLRLCLGETLGLGLRWCSLPKCKSDHRGDGPAWKAEGPAVQVCSSRTQGEGG